MRSIDANITAFSRDMTAGSVPASTVAIPAIGSLLGINMRLTEDAGDSDGTILSGARITAAIERIQIRDRTGLVVLNLTGLALERIANELSAVGDDVDAPVPGDGSATEWLRFLPLTIAQRDMPAYMDVTWAPETALYSAAPTLATAITLNVRGAYTRAEGVQTIRIKSSTPAHALGDNALGHLLPDGELVEKLLLIPNDPGSNPMVDTDIGSLRLVQDGFNLLDGATVVDKFEPEDAEFRRDGHNAGTLNVRVPVFKVNNTTQLILNLSVDADFDVVTVSRRPQPSK